MNSILNMSLTGAFIAMVIMVIRMIIQNKVSKRLVYALWSILLFHLLVPYMIPSSLSIFNYVEVPKSISESFSTKGSPNNYINETRESYENNVNNSRLNNNTSNTILNPDRSSTSNTPVHPTTNELNTTNSLSKENNLHGNTSKDMNLIYTQKMTPDQLTQNNAIDHLIKNTYFITLTTNFIAKHHLLMRQIWLSGMILFTLLFIITYSTFAKHMHEAVLYKDIPDILEACKKRVKLKRDVMIYTSNYTNTPLVFGITKPRIILPSNFIQESSINELSHVITHEMFHIKRLDYLLKPICLFLLCMHWFNPILWVSYFLSQKDMEMSCDEKVIFTFENDVRKEYARSLVKFAEEQNNLLNKVTLAFGENNVKTRIKSVLGSKKTAKWISIFVVVLIIPLAVVLLTGKAEKSDDSDVSEAASLTKENAEIDSNNKTSETTGKNNLDKTPSNNNKDTADEGSKENSEADNNQTTNSNSEGKEDINKEEFDNNLDVLSATRSLISGYSYDIVKEKHPSEYQYIIDHDYDSIDLLLKELEAVTIPREKITQEWLITEIIKSHAEEANHIREEHTYTFVTSDQCKGRLSPDVNGQVWCELPKNTVLHISGFYNMDWYLAKLVTPDSMNIDQLNQNYIETSQVEFWINAADIERDITWKEDITGSNMSAGYAEEYKYMINGQMEERYDERKDQESKFAILRKQPSDTSDPIGFVYENELIAVQKDIQNNKLKYNEWTLIRQINDGIDQASVGWVKSDYINDLTPESKPAHGYLLRNTKIYENSDGTSSEMYTNYIKEYMKHIPIRLIYILERKDGWVHFNVGINTFAGWVREEDIYYQITDEVSAAVYHPEPDFDMFIEELKTNILENENFTIKAKDINGEKNLSDQEKRILAKSLKSIESGEKFDGGVGAYREAIYPFYSLDFGEYNMVVTVDDRLLLQLGPDISYDYGIGTEGGRWRWVKPNKEFITTIFDIYSVEKNDNTDHYNYLLNAKKLVIVNNEGTAYEPFELQVHMNKSARAIKEVMGEEIEVSNPDDNITDKTEYIYTFEDGSEMIIVFTNRYILWNNRYYAPLQMPQEVLGGLFAAYF